MNGLKMWHTYDRILFGPKKEENSTICNNMDEPGKHYVE
jgi:hypothetical protein